MDIVSVSRVGGYCISIKGGGYCISIKGGSILYQYQRWEDIVSVSRLCGYCIIIQIFHYFNPMFLFLIRIAKWSDSFPNQIFCKVPCTDQADISAPIVLSGISGHFPFVIDFKILNKRPVPTIYIYIYIYNKISLTESSLGQYCTALDEIFIHSWWLILRRVLTDHIKYLKIDIKIISTVFSWKYVKSNKYQH